MHRFYLHNGIVISTMEELVQILPSLGEDIFSYHVNNQKNDFANWIRDVFGEKNLAKQILNLSQNDMAKKINTFIAKSSKSTNVKDAGSGKKESTRKSATPKAPRALKAKK